MIHQHDDNWNDDELYLNRRILARMTNTQYKTQAYDITQTPMVVK